MYVYLYACILVDIIILLFHAVVFVGLHHKNLYSNLMKGLFCLG